MSAGTPLENSPAHVPVLYHEVLQYLQPSQEMKFVDGTLGAAGHAYGILQQSAPAGQLLGLDLDPTAIALAEKKLAPFSDRVVVALASYSNIRQEIARINWQSVDGVLVDLGVSSMQLDTPEKGFSFQSDGPLDMRFNPEQEQSAREVVNQYAQTELVTIFRKYGEMSGAGRIAEAIIKARPIETTGQLTKVISSVVKINPRKAHPATLVFQAIRIEVNQELAGISAFLPEATSVLHSGGRLAVISFHSLEDRIVKHYFQLESKDCICPPKQPICTCGHKASIRILTKKSIQASPEEMKFNSRARSARLRVVEKL
ncbi:MAG: 16S rRNA (cytosine(1402)-N(4))-methyltransferase RsmH [Anaerolineaceae bacterium]|nr:16S rRNA (cytosine(1402)-N(4))-methyltransferase RsmH [Anaerolineaceae bacterium]